MRHLGGIFFFLMLLAPIAAQSAKTERNVDGAGAIVFDTAKLPELTGGEVVPLFNFALGDKRVEFLAQGYWQSTVSSTSTYSFGFGSTPGFSLGTPVFTQKVDLSLWFMLDRHWYFEADFADEFTKNTVAAGYVGDGVVRSVRIANRGIIFPDFYSIDDVNRGIGGGENQAPGVSFHFAGKKWQSHLAVRYDMLKSEEKTWYGKNSVSTDDIALSAFQTGSRYVLPTAEAVSSVRDVYVESSNGSYRDAQGRRYKKLDASQYLLSPSSYTVLLAKDAGAAKVGGVLPAVAFAFSGTTAEGVVAAASDFLQDVQDWFSEGGVDVTQFFLRVNTDAALSQFVSRIDGEDVLFVQHPSGFSPFTVAYRYDAGLTTATDAAVASHQTEATVPNYAAVIGEDDISFVSEDFFFATHTYADIYRTDSTATDTRSAHVRFPFADCDAGIYLGYTQKSDWELKVRTYTPVSRFDIGTDAMPGTVRVYKNGILDSGATYDSESGSIALSSAVSASDHIYATWYEDSEDADSGAIAAAAGFEYRPTERVSGDLSLSTRWALAVDRKFADADYSSPGFATVASRVRYEGDQLSLSNTVAASLESANTTGKYRILGMDDKASDTVYLAKNAAVDLPSGFEPLLNPRPTDSTTLPVLDAEKNGSKAATDGSNDSAISGYAVPVGWNFGGIAGTTDSPAWASVAIRLPAMGGTLASASTFSIALKNPTTSIADIAVYLQLGVQADDDFSVEDSAVIPTWLVSKRAGDDNPTDVRSAFVPSTAGWQTVTVMLSDRDRSRLAYYHDARIVITATTASASEILVGPYQADGVSFAVAHHTDTSVSSYQTTDATLSAAKIDTFNTGTNYVQKIDWHTYDGSAFSDADDVLITATRYFEEVDMENYETLSLWFKYNPTVSSKTASGASDFSDDILLFTLDRPDEAKKAVEIVVKSTDISASSVWHELTVDLESKSVNIDGAKVGTAYLNRSVIPVRFKIELNTAASSSDYYADGECAVDELTLHGTSPYVVLQDKARVAWKKDGTLIEKNGYAVLKDVSLAATGTGSRTVQTSGAGKDDDVLSSTAQAVFTLADVRIAGDIALSSATEKTLSSAAHAVETARPLFDSLSFVESYSYNPDERALEKENGVMLSLGAHDIPLTVQARTESQSNLWAMTQQASAQAETNIGIVSWSAKAKASQKMLPTASGITLLSTESYGQGWLSATELAFDAGDENASRRAIGAETQIAVQLPLLNAKPTVTAKTDGAYKSVTKQTFADDTSFSFALPFSVGKNAFSVSWKKAGGGVSAVSKGGSYGRDVGDLRAAYDDIDWLFTAFPLYDVISSDLAKKVHSDTAKMTTHSAESNYYTGTYEASWKRGFYGNKYDLIFPANVSLSFARDIRTAASTADVYQAKATVGYTALNVFGVTGIIPLATWFQQDEYAASLSAVLKIPRTAPENISMLYTGYAQANFFVSQTNSFKTGLEGSFADKHNWSGKITAIWKRLASHSMMLGAMSLLRPKYDKSTAKLTRTDSINLGMSQAAASAVTSSEVTTKISGEYTHQLDIAVNRFVTINTLLGGSYACTWDKIVTIGGTLSIGGTVRF